MGKKRTKQSSGSKNRNTNAEGSADSQDEMESTQSEADLQSVMSIDETVPSNDLEQASQTDDILREKLSDAINLLDSRTTSDRENSLKYLCNQLSSYFLPIAIDNWQETLCSAALKCLSKGKKSEANLAAKLLFLLFVQFGPERMSQNCEEIKKALLLASNNVNHSMEVRGRFLYTMALCSFFSLDSEQDEVLLENLETVICGTMRKEVVPLVTHAFEGWSVMAIQFRSERVIQNYEKLLFRILKIFEEFQDNKELRLAAGKMVALIYETINDPNGNSHKKFQKYDELYDLLNELSRQGGKVVAKKDKKAQKSSLREALCYMEGDYFKLEVVKFGRESLNIDSYSKYLMYEFFKEILGAGINRHLTENPWVRDLFDLGDQNSNAHSQLDKKRLKNILKGEFSENDKARTLHLKRQRAKRTDQSYE